MITADLSLALLGAAEVDVEATEKRQTDWTSIRERML